jgi:hypothetical protein
MAKIANVALTNTFDTWRSRSNEAFDRLSQFAINNSSLYANTLTANASFRAKGTSVLQGGVTINRSLVVNNNITVSGNTTITGLATASGRLTVGTNLTVSGNTTIGAAGKVFTSTGLHNHVGRQTISTNLYVAGNTVLGNANTVTDRTIINGVLVSNGNFSVAGNTTIGAAGKTANVSGWFGVAGRATVSTNLFVGANTTVAGRLGVGGAPFSNVKFAITDTTAIKIPSGNTSQRPTGGAGYLRYNVTLASFEGYNTSTSSWGSIGGGAVGNTNSIFWENDRTITANYTITANKNAGTFGPVTLNSGVTVTVPANSTWSIV